MTATADATHLALVAEQLCASADLQAGWRVLDAATGSGAGAIAAARRGCAVVGVDGVPSLLERGRLRAAAEGLDIDLLEGDAEALPFPDASFDAVISVFGCMFEPDHARVARELLRVVKPGGAIALASWTPEGFFDELTQTVASHAAPVEGPSPMLWGAEEHLEWLFCDCVASLEMAERTLTLRLPPPEHLVAFLGAWHAPTARALAALGGPARDALETDLAALAARFARADGDASPISATYVEAVALAR